MKFIEVLYDTMETYDEEDEPLREPIITEALIKIDTITSCEKSASRVYIENLNRLKCRGPEAIKIKTSEDKEYLIINKSYTEMRRILLAGNNLINIGSGK